MRTRLPFTEKTNAMLELFQIACNLTPANGCLNITRVPVFDLSEPTNKLQAFVVILLRDVKLFLSGAKLYECLQEAMQSVSGHVGRGGGRGEAEANFSCHH